MAEKESKKVTVNRTYKDTVFRKLFSDRKNLLSLYNAINAAFSPTIFELTFWHIAHILTVAKECGEIP